MNDNKLQEEPSHSFYNLNTKRKKSKAPLIIAVVMLTVILVSVGGCVALLSRSAGVSNIFDMDEWMDSVREREEVRLAIAYVESHPRIAEFVGEIENISLGDFDIHTTAGRRGDAFLVLHVDGSEGNVQAHIRLMREPSHDWEILSLNIQISIDNSD